jgi:hypothetical protein
MRGLPYIWGINDQDVSAKLIGSGNNIISPDKFASINLPEQPG